ncbi:MAG TPA: trimethylamine methyltransferase family protein, partial [Candidatus Deferrimicrobium sp.]|nr:trimethylamine methyltransferase family protein [Candidatus Deferrimicrobium sp.]
MRPKLRFLSDELILQILSEARDLLCKIGMKVYHNELLALLSDHGAAVDKNSKNVIFTNDIIDKALKTVPSSFQLYDIQGNRTHDFSQYNVHFTPASSSLNIFDDNAGGMRKPNTLDYIRYVKLVSRLKYIASQSTAFVPADVSEKIGDSYRLYLALLYGEKPVVTGTFNEGGFGVMKQMQVVV